MRNSMTVGKTSATASALAVATVLMLLSVPCAHSQDGAEPIAGSKTIVKPDPRQPIELPSRQYAPEPVFTGNAASGIRSRELSRSFSSILSQQPSSPTVERSAKRKVLGAIVGGVGGFLGGGLLGAIIASKTCNPCDDPEIAGFLIGAPIGGTAGSILGYRFLF